MKSFEIHKASLDNKFTGINTKVLGQAIGDLKYCGLKLYLYLASHPDNSNWTVNPSVYADWVGTDYSSKGRSVRKIIDDGIADLIENNYIFDHDAILPDFLKETKLRYRFDFIIYNEDGSIKCLIEYDGRQHFYGPDTTYWSRTTDSLEDIRYRDNLKNQFCITHHYPLYRIPFTALNNLTIDTLFDSKYLVKE